MVCGALVFDSLSEARVLSTSTPLPSYVRVADDPRIRRTVESLRRVMVNREAEYDIPFDSKMLARAELIIAVFCNRTEAFDDYIVKAGVGVGDELTVILTKIDYSREISVDFSPNSGYTVFKTEAPITTETEIQSLSELGRFIDWVFGTNGD